MLVVNPDQPTAEQSVFLISGDYDPELLRLRDQLADIRPNEGKHSADLL